jgi:hypothetical protein
MSVELTQPPAEPGKDVAAPAEREIPWTSRAKFLELGKAGQLSGSLRDCVAAYAALDPLSRRRAMIICDDLVPTGPGRLPARKLDPADINHLVDALQPA